MKYIYVAKSLVRRSDGKYLMLKRSQTDADSPGRVDLPGGGVEAGESFDQTIRRELSEEAGIDAPSSQTMLVYTFSKIDDQVVKLRFLYLTKVSSPIIRLSHEHDDFLWLDLAELQRSFAETSWGVAINELVKNSLLD